MDKQKIEAWMRENSQKHEYGSAFDLAVDCSYALQIFDDDNYTISQEIVDIAESIMGKD